MITAYNQPTSTINSLVQFSAQSKGEKKELKLGADLVVAVDPELPIGIQTLIQDAFSAFEEGEYFADRKNTFSQFEIPDNLEILVTEATSVNKLQKRTYGDSFLALILGFKEEDGSFTPLSVQVGGQTNVFARKEISGKYGLLKAIEELYHYGFDDKFEQPWEGHSSAK